MIVITPYFQLMKIGKELSETHPHMHIAQTCFENIFPQHFLSLADSSVDEYPDL